MLNETCRGTGFLKEPLHFKDFNHHKIYGSAAGLIPQEVTRDVSGIPIIFQGSVNSCVSCAVTWIKQYFESAHPALSWEFIAKQSETGTDGATPSQVLEPARKIGICTEALWKEQIAESLRDEDAGQHKIVGYAFLNRFDLNTLYQAVSVAPIMIGVDNYRGVGAHMMVAYGLNADLKSLKCISWWNPSSPDLVDVLIDDVTFGCSFFNNVIDNAPTFNPVTVVASQVSHLVVNKIGWGWSHSFIALLAVLGIIIFPFFHSSAPAPAPKSAPVVEPAPMPEPASSPSPVPEQNFGAGGIVDKFAPSVAGAGQSATSNVLPVSSFTAYTGEVMTTSSLQFPIYLIVNPQSTTDREKEECNGLDSTNLLFTGCSRGLSAFCNNATSSVVGAAFPHPAGEPVLMSNDSCFFNRFVDTNTSQTVGGVKTWTATSTYLGDDTTGTGKQIYFRVGQTNNPYFKVVGPPAGNTTSTFFFSMDGTTDLQLNASGTVVGASSTAAIQFVNGLVAVKASSTASQNGGLLVFNSAGQILFDLVNFLKMALTWVGNQIFSGTVTFNGNATSTASFQVQNPVASMDAVNKSYVDAATATTGTAGMAISSGDALYVSTTGTLFQTNSSVASSTYQFVGFSQGTYANGSIVTIISVGRNICTFSGLSAGYSYYLNGTNGQIATTGTTLFARVGRAVSSSCLSVLNPKFIKSGSTTVNGVGTTLVTTGFYPAYITITAVDNDDFQNGSGISFGNDSNMASFATTTAPGIVDIVGYGATSTSAWYVIRNNVIRGEGTVSSKSATGFTLNEKQHQATEAVVLQWTAWSE